MNKSFVNQALLSALQGANSILLCTHFHPDGDAVGTTLATYQALSDWGKRVTICCQDALPRKYQCLPTSDAWRTPEDIGDAAFDAVLALDAGDEGRLGTAYPLFAACPVTMQIDHHATNTHYAAHNEVDGEASSAGVMAWRLMKALSLPVTEDIAPCLYAAISSDTGNFNFRNTDAETFSCAAALMEAGLDIGRYALKLHLTKQEAHVRLIGRAVSTLRVFGGGKASAMTLTKRDFDECGASDEHENGVVGYAKSIAGVGIAYLADDLLGFVKCSLRAEPPYDVSKIAQTFGGGGHVLASGCRIDLPLDEACALLDKEILAAIEGA